MSQVRKLLNGNSIPKAQKGYKFRLDSQDVYFTDDDLKEIDNMIAKLPMEYRRFLGNATTAIKSGNQSGNRANNTVTMPQLSNLDEKNSDRLRKQKATYWEALVNSDSYVAKEAINEYLQILATVANKSNNFSSSKKIDKTPIPLDFNKDKEGKYSLSSTAGENFSARTRIEQVLEHLNAGETSPYDLSDWDLTGVTGWWNGLGDDKNTAAQQYLTDLWNRMSTPGYEWGGADEDFLRNFGISWKANDPAYSGTTVASPASQHVDESGKIKPGSQNSDGTYGLIVGDGTNGRVSGALYTTWVAPDERPYLLNEDRLARFGLDSSYLNGIIYKSRVYRPEEVAQNVELKQIMDDVVLRNNSATSADDVWDNVGEILNFTDYSNNYVPYNSDIHYMPNRALRKALGQGNYAIFNPTSSYDLPEGVEIFGVYDFNGNGTGTWNFRLPKYYIYSKMNNGGYNITDPVDNIDSFQFLNRNWTKMDNFRVWEDIRGKRYGLVGQFWGSDAHDTTPYTIYEDTEGVYYTKLPNGNMQRLDDDLALAIITGKDSSGNDFKPNHNQMLYGTFSGKMTEDQRRKVTNLAVSEGRFATHSVLFKEGGRVELKPLPFKLQMGSRLAVTPGTPQQIEVQESPLAESSNLWETLTPADQKEIIAAGIDVAGAIAGLVPYGSIAAAATGVFGSTPLFLQAAKERKGYLDASDWGQAALAWGLDLVSLIPYLGETGKIAKIAKAVTRVAVPLGKAFNVLGLSQAASVLSKNPKDWDTNDLLKLSAGIQSIVNIGHSAHIRHGESALASEISRIKGKPGEIPHSFKIGDTDVKLTEAEIKAISDSSNNAEEILQGILRGRGISDEQMTNLPQLLERFGFNTKTKGWGKKKRTVATVKEPEKNPEYTKYGWIFDEFDPSATREFKRREYIDSNLTPEIRAKLEPSLLETSDFTIKTPREIIVTSRRSPKNTPEARAYVQALARNGEAQTSWFARPKIKSNETTTVDRTPGMQLDAERAISRGEGLPRYSEMVDNAVKMFTTPSETTGIQTESLIPGPAIRTNPVERLGLNAVSNKELKQYLIGLNSVGRREGVEFLKALPERKRRSLLKALSQSKSQKAQDLVRHFNEDGSLKTVGQKIQHDFDKVHEKINDSLTKQRLDQRQIRKGRILAQNIKKLKNSTRPMDTLAEISSTPEEVHVINVVAPYSFRQALNSNLREAAKRMNGPRLDRYVTTAEGTREKLGLKFKKGGIVKAQDGTYMPESQTYVNIGTIDNPIWRLVGPDGNPILVEGDLGYQPTQNTEVVNNDNLLTTENQNVESNDQTTSNETESVEDSTSQTPSNNQYNPSIIKLENERDLKSNSPQYIRIGNVELNKQPKVKNVPLVKQNIVKIGSDGLKELISLWRQINSFKKGGIIKAQFGTNVDPNWNVPGWDIHYGETIPSWRKIPREFSIGFNPQTSGVLGMNDFDPTSGVTLADIVTGNKTSADIGKSEISTDVGGGPNKNLLSKLKWVNPLLSLGRFTVNAHLQNKYRDLAKQSINAARFNEQPVRINTARTDSPELDRALQQVKSERMQGLKPVTSDLIANNALYNQREAQLYNRENQIVGQRSQYQRNMDLKNLDIMNQNIQNEVTVANNNRARTASINSALYNPDLEYIQRRGQSIENLGLEIQNNIKKDIDLITSHNKLAKQKEISDATDKFIDTLAPGLRATYNNLPYSERIKYTDFLDYLERTDPKYGSYRTQIEDRKKQDQTDMLDWLYNEGLNYSYPSWLTGKTSKVGIRKKGGYINGSTRYTMEPDERIWVENNKATHRAIAKLNDNTIKLLLRALK